MSDNDKARNKLANDIFAGRTIESVDATAVNSWEFYFRDGTKTTLSVEAISEYMGFYGIVIAETSFDPTETIGPGRKPGDARKAIEDESS